MQSSHSCCQSTAPSDPVTHMLTHTNIYQPDKTQFLKRVYIHTNAHSETHIAGCLTAKTRGSVSARVLPSWVKGHMIHWEGPESVAFHWITHSLSNNCIKWHQASARSCVNLQEEGLAPRQLACWMTAVVSGEDANTLAVCTNTCLLLPHTRLGFLLCYCLALSLCNLSVIHSEVSEP